MKTFFLKGKLNEELFQDMNEYLDTLENEKQPGQIYINSQGGGVWVLDSLLARLEELKAKEINITLRLIFGGSAGFTLFSEYTGKKVLERDCDAIYHVVASSNSFFKTEKGELLIRGDKTDKLRWENFQPRKHPDFLTETERNIADAGEDVYLSYERLKEIFTKTP